MLVHKLNKKGNLDDVVETMLILITFVVFFFVMYSVMGGFKSNVETNPNMNTSTAALNFISVYQTRYNNSWDYAALLITILFPIMSFIAARKIPIDSAAFIIFIFIAGFYCLAAMITANMYGAMLENAKFAAFIADTTFIKIIMPNLLWYSMIYMAIVAFGLYTKESS